MIFLLFTFDHRDNFCDGPVHVSLLLRRSLKHHFSLDHRNNPEGKMQLFSDISSHLLSRSIR